MNGIKKEEFLLWGILGLQRINSKIMKKSDIPIRKKLLFTIITVCLVIFFLEITIAIFSGLDDIRTTYYSFNNEVKSLDLYTSIYKIDQKVIQKREWRPEGDKYFALGDYIKFFTDKEGYITVSKEYKRKGVKDKIIFVGGSTTECNEVDEELRFPFLAGEILYEDYGLIFDTLNYGVRGHTTQDSITLLMYLHRYQNPKYVVMMHNINDQSWLKNNLTYKIYPYQKTLKDSIIKKIDKLRYSSNIIFMVLRFLERVGLIEERFPGEHRPSDRIAKEIDEYKIQKDPNELSNSFYEQFTTNLNVFVELCGIYGIKPVLMTQPLGENDSQRAVFNRLIRDTSEKLSVSLIDLDAQMPQDRRKYFFPDNIHFNNEGSILISKIIARDLTKIIKEE